MKFLMLLLALALPAFGAIEDFAVKPLTAEQLNARQLVKDQPARTYEVKTFPKDTVFYTGLLKPNVRSTEEPSTKFMGAGTHKGIDLRTLNTVGIFNQGQCGSCVYNALTAAFEIDLWLRGMKLDHLSRQYLMSCGSRNSMCNGSWAEIVGGDLVKMKGLPFEAEYPYTASNAACRGTNFTMHGQIVSATLISTSDDSIMGGLDALHPVYVTVGAGGEFMNAGSGILNRCQSVGTNHQVVIEGYYCIDAAKNKVECVVGADGNVAPGSLIWIMRNNWGTGYGNNGWIEIVARDSRGNKCYNLAEEAGVFDTGLTPTPPTPPGPGPVPPTPSDDNLWKYIVAGAAVLIAFLLGFFLKKK